MQQDRAPTEILEIHAKAGPASQFGLGDFIDFERWQYKVIAYDRQLDGSVKIRLQPTGYAANHRPPG